MAEEAAALSGRLHNKTVEGRIKRKFKINASNFFFFLHQF
jgi:hypothetical protein